jgi:hypothetical protein
MREQREEMAALKRQNEAMQAALTKLEASNERLAMR